MSVSAARRTAVRDTATHRSLGGRSLRGRAYRRAAVRLHRLGDALKTVPRSAASVSMLRQLCAAAGIAIGGGVTGRAPRYAMKRFVDLDTVTTTHPIDVAPAGSPAVVLAVYNGGYVIELVSAAGDAIRAYFVDEDDVTHREPSEPSTRSLAA